MLDMIKLLLAEARHQIESAVILGRKADAEWLETIKSPEFATALSIKAQSHAFKAADLLACFVEGADHSENAVHDHLEAIYQHILWRHYPKVGIEAMLPGIDAKAGVFMPLFRAYHRYGLKLTPDAFLARFPFKLLSEEEIMQLEDPTEYRYVQSAFQDDYIYEMMVLNHEIKGYSTVDHISGVHYLAMYIARQIKAQGIAIDLGWVSGAAALHDMGKFGCLPDEVKKVAYYHYYYSDLWFRDRDITYIRQIAVNHSTWDLELSNLPIESLVLIYADFRVKGHDDPSWPYPMKFFDLAESFHVIFDKLDNVDAEKEKRYKKVYEKLKDFEVYLEGMGVQTSWFHENEKEIDHWFTADPALLSEAQVHQRLRTTAVAHNVAAMHTFRNEESLKEFLNQAKNLGDSHTLRRHVHLLAQFSRYLTDGQKFTILDFLFELFLHAEEDLRKQAAETFGQIIAHFDAPYGKYLPPSAPGDAFRCSKSDVLRPYCAALTTMEDRTDVKARRIGLALVTVFKQVLATAKQIESTLALLVTLIAPRTQGHNFGEGDYFIKVLASVDPIQLTDDQVQQLLPVLIENLKATHGAEERRVDALLALKQLSKAHRDAVDQAMSLASLLTVADYSDLIKRRIESPQTLHQVYLENSHLNTPDEVKKRNIAGILHYVVTGHPDEAFGAAIHCCNLLKGSLAQDVRLSAAKAIVVLNVRLMDSEHLEVVMELMRGLEIDHYAYTKYMPQTLGRLLVGLGDDHMDTVLTDLTYRIKTGSPSLKVLILETVAHAINAAQAAKHKGEGHGRNLERMLGILTSGLVQADEAVHLAAFQGLSVTLLKTHLTNVEQRGHLFALYSKKMATLMHREAINPRVEAAYAYNFSVLYHFITEHMYESGPLPLKETRVAAYFQGAFDPVSLGQKGVVLALEERQVTVYVGLDAFCWQRQTQPTRHRRRMLEMTFADCLNTYLVPRGFSVHFSRPESLEKLKRLLPEGTPYLVMGEDALVTHSLYKEHLDQIKAWPHFLVSRQSLTSKRQQQVAQIRSQLSVSAQIDPISYYSTITPDLVRRSIDRQLDLEDVLDTLAIQYIRDHHLYRNEPQFKASLEQKHIEMVNLESLTLDLEQEMSVDLQMELNRVKALSPEVLSTLRLIVVRDGELGHIIAAGAYRRLQKGEYDTATKVPVMRRDYVDLYPENTAVIELLHVNLAKWQDDYTFSLQSELMVDAIQQGYDYAVYSAHAGNLATDVLEALRATGFVELQELRWLLVSLKSPVALILDAQSALKEDYRQEPELRAVLKRMRIAFLRGIVKTYPGQLVLPFDRGMLYDRLVHMVTSTNQPEPGKAYGPAVAVPYGDLFKRWTLPDTITKSLHTERVYDETLSYFDVQASPYHLPVAEQIGLLKDFDAPVLLIDDILDKGLRLQGIENGFKDHGIPIEGIVVGIMSGLGYRRMTQRGYEVRAGYYLPNLSAWFTESLMYPFIGGDAVSSQGQQVVRYGVLQGVNRIAPYFTSPEAKGISVQQYLQLSEICLENATLFMKTLEAVYASRRQRPLGIDRLSEVFLTPRMPYYGDGVHLHPDSLASTQLAYDRQRLSQMLKLVARK